MRRTLIMRSSSVRCRPHHPHVDCDRAASLRRTISGLISISFILRAVIEKEASERKRRLRQRGAIGGGLPAETRQEVLASLSSSIMLSTSSA